MGGWVWSPVIIIIINTTSFNFMYSLIMLNGIFPSAFFFGHCIVLKLFCLNLIFDADYLSYSNFYNKCCVIFSYLHIWYLKEIINFQLIQMQCHYSEISWLEILFEQKKYFSWNEGGGLPFPIKHICSPGFLVFEYLGEDISQREAGILTFPV